MTFLKLYTELLDQIDYVRMYPSAGEYFIEGRTRKSKEYFDFHKIGLEKVVATALTFCKESNDRFNLQR
jgi:hypothetical protein